MKETEPLNRLRPVRRAGGLCRMALVKMSIANADQEDPICLFHPPSFKDDRILMVSPKKQLRDL